MDTKPASSNQLNLRKIINRLVIVVSVGIVANLVFLLLTNDQNIFGYLSRIEVGYFLLILVFLTFNWLGHGLRMVIWTQYLGQAFRFRTALKIAVYTELGASITPTMIGGGPIKLALLAKNGLTAGKAAFVTLLGGIEDFFMYSFVFVISFFYAKNEVFQIVGSIANLISRHWLKIVVIIIVLVLLRYLFKALNISFIPARHSGSWRRILSQIRAEWKEMLQIFGQVIKNGLGYFIVSFIVLICQWMGRFTVLVILLLALGIEFEPFRIYLQQWIVYLTMIFIPTPGATGGAEATFFLLFEGEVPKELLPLIVSTWRFFMYYLMLFTAVVLVQYFHFSNTALENPGE